ncbi:hypothetical protein [Geothrix campi]|uniref:hypothetical protein n=1 Tax=Geothrix campi TaxID=2966450 RepID=UPI002147C2D2|nr:hypothetical protein [Geothrix sp. SG10]
MHPRALLPMLSFGLAFGVACVSPSVTQGKMRAFEAGLLGSIQDGQTTRQEVLLRLGTPSSAFEGGRILTYDFAANLGGEWERAGGGQVSEWAYPHPRAASLVLVFGPDDRLVRHSLVKHRRQPDPPVQEAVSQPSD